MSCKLKRTIEKYQERTPYDQMMNKVYDPNIVKVYPAPWPMERTQFDKNMQKNWAPNCSTGNIENYKPTKKRTIIRPEWCTIYKDKESCNTIASQNGCFWLNNECVYESMF